MSDEKKTKKTTATKAPAKDPVVYVLYRGDAEIVGVCTRADTARETISADRDVQFARVSVARQKRGARA
jgi:hypothetical protein